MQDRSVGKVQSNGYTPDVVCPIAIRRTLLIAGRRARMRRTTRRRRRRIRSRGCRRGYDLGSDAPIVIKVVWNGSMPFVIDDYRPNQSAKLAPETTRFRAQGPGDGKDSRSLMPSHIPSCSALRRLVMRFVLPHRMKSASFNWPMNACLHESAEGGRRSFSVGGDARWRISFNGATCRFSPDPEAGAPGRIEADMMWLS